jgi:hypothetical protein
MNNSSMHPNLGADRWGPQLCPMGKSLAGLGWQFGATVLPTGGTHNSVQRWGHPESNFRQRLNSGPRSGWVHSSLTFVKRPTPSLSNSTHSTYCRRVLLQVGTADPSSCRLSWNLVIPIALATTLPLHSHSTQFAPHRRPLTSNQGHQSGDGLLVDGRVEGFWAPSRPETRIGGILEACWDCAGGGCEGAMGIGPGGGGGAGARPRSPGRLQPTGPQAEVRWGSSAPHRQEGQDGRFLGQRGVRGLPTPLAGFQLGTAGKFCSFYQINLPPL